MTKGTSQKPVAVISGSTDTDLPEGWVEVPLSECCEINPRHPRGLDDAMPVSFAPMAALSEDKPTFQELEERPLGSVRKGFTHFAEGDVLFAKITPCMENGKGAVATGLCNGLGCGTTELHVIRPLAGVDALYVYRFLSQGKIRSAAKETFTSSAGQARVPTSFIKELQIFLPPLAEQKRIVAKVEELLGQVNAAREKLAKVPVILNRFRQSVLAAACSGRLTEEWRASNLSPELSITATPSFAYASDMTALPATWRWEKLPSLGELNRGKSRHRPRNSAHLYGGPYPFIQTGDIAQSGGRITKHTQEYSNAGLEQSRLWPTRTVCITIAANIADSAILTYPACFPDSIVGFVASPALILAEYVEFFIRTARGDLAQFAPATAQKNINIAILNQVAVPLPPLPEQHEIVRRVERLFALADSIEKQAAAAKVRVEKLTQAILAKAFRGEWVPTEAEIARRERRG